MLQTEYGGLPAFEFETDSGVHVRELYTENGVAFQRVSLPDAPSGLVISEL